jgi:phosphohistidine phosphatase SixA
VRKNLAVTAVRKMTHSGISRNRKTLFAIICVIALGVTVYSCGKLASPRALEHSSTTELAQLKASWAKGDIIAIVRHAERCDQSKAPCLSTPDGITARGRDDAAALGGRYRVLGLTKTDIFNSPLTRTKQTATAMFSEKVQDQEWLASCRMTLLQDALKHKRNGYNLILVTHSGCIKDIERGLGFDGAKKPGYISTLFLSIDRNDHDPTLLGLMAPSGFKRLSDSFLP